MTDTIFIDSTLVVRDILHRFPASRTVLAAAGLDTCCAAGEPLHAAAHRAGVDLDALLGALSAELARPAANQPAQPASCACSAEAR